MSKKILFFGNERLATGVHSSVPTLQALLASGYEVPAVVVAQSPDGKSRQGRQLEIAAIARQHRIPLLAPRDLAAAADELAGFGAEAAVLISYGKIVPQALLDLFPKGIINIHPSLLPLRRGSSPIESAILDGAAETGVSLMRLTAKMDTGPLYGQRTQGMNSRTSKQLLADTLLFQGVQMLIETLPAILDGTAKPVEQSGQATYTRLIQKSDGFIDWNKSAQEIQRGVLAYAGWPRSRAAISGKPVVITKTKPLDDVAQGGAPGTVKNDNGRLVAFCKWGALEIESLIPEGKKEMSGSAFAAGYIKNG